MLPEFVVEQTNALRSWKALSCKPKIVVVGNDQGVAELCEREGVTHHPIVEKNKYGTPLIKSILEQGWTYADDNDIVVFINGDIVLVDDFTRTLQAFSKHYPEHHNMTYLLTARRFDWTNFHEIDFNKTNWFETLDLQGEWSGANAVDLFVHRKGQLAMPDSAIARFAYDTWALMNAIKNYDLCIDISESCKMIHHLGKHYFDGMPCARGIVSHELYENSQPIYNDLGHKFGPQHRWCDRISDAPLKSTIDQQGEIQFVENDKRRSGR